MDDLYCVLDLADSFVLYTGTLEECEQVQEESYGGVIVIEASYATELIG
jgi:hypothetical protein